MSHKKKYIPALGLDILTPLYDPLMKVFMRESVFKRQLIAQAQIESGYRILDLGCGTGTLTILVKRTHPGAELIGLDGDEKILKIARTKALKSGLEIRFDQGMAYDLPYPDHSFDRMLSTLMIHHLNTEDKQRTFNEAFRVLVPGGEFHIADFGKPHNTPAHILSRIIRRFEEASDNVEGRLAEMAKKAGFSPLQELTHYLTLFGTLSLMKCVKNETAVM